MEINGLSYEELFNLAIQKPTLAQLEITQNCNQECSFCFKGCSYHKRFEDLPLSAWKDIIKNLSDFGVETVNFTGGEIFIFPRFAELLSYAKSVGIKKIIANTNGTMPLADYDLSGIDSLVFSVHGLHGKHDAIVGKKGAFDRLSENIKLLAPSGIVAINVVVTEDNIQDLDDILAYFKPSGLQFYSFNLAGDIGGSTKVTEAFFKEYLSFIRRMEKEIGDRVLLRHGMQNIAIGDRGFFEAKIPLPHCAAGKYKLVVDYKGDVFPCSFFQSPDFYCGNILEDSLPDIWNNGKGFLFFRRQYLDQSNLPEGCRTCFKRHKCGGGCLVWRSLGINGKKYEKDIRCDFGASYIGA